MGRRSAGVRAQELPHLFVGCLVEIEIPLPDGGERLRRASADDLIGDRGQCVARVGRADRNCHYYPCRVPLPDGLDGGHHG